MIGGVVPEKDGVVAPFRAVDVQVRHQVLEEKRDNIAVCCGVLQRKAAEPVGVQGCYHRKPWLNGSEPTVAAAAL